MAAAVAGCATAPPGQSSAASVPSTASGGLAGVTAGTTPAVVIQPDRDVTFDSGGVPTHASYRGPVAGTTGAPAAIIIGGTGDIDRNGTAPTNPPLKTDTYSWLADLLSAQGIASIRYDKLGTGADRPRPVCRGSRGHALRWVTTGCGSNPPATPWPSSGRSPVSTGSDFSSSVTARAASCR